MAQLFHCPWLLTPDGWQQDGLLEVDDHGHIAAIGAEGTHHLPTDLHTDLPGAVIPGMANVHSHAHQRLIAGLTGVPGQGRDSFWSWREQMYRATCVLDPERFYAVAAWLFAELLEGGYTSLGEFHYLHRADEDRAAAMWQTLARAAADTGMNLTVLPVWYRYSGFGRRAPAPQQAPFVIDSADEYLALVEEIRQSGITVGLAPHSLRAVDVDDLPALIEAVPQGPIHIHICEQTAEVQACQQHTGTTPIRLLHERAGLDERWCLIHATHTDAEEIEIMADAGSVVGLCPTTEADLGDGLFPARELRDAGGRFGIGSDSNLRVQAAEELRLLEWSQRYRLRERNVLSEAGCATGQWLWQHAASTGHQALTQPGGALAAGLRADFLVLDTAHPLLAGASPNQWLDNLVFADQAGMIAQVWTAGQMRVDGGRHRARSQLSKGWLAARRCVTG